MPVAVTHFLDSYAPVPSRRPALAFAGAGLVLGAAVWSLVGGPAHASGAASGVEPLYPDTAPVVAMVDVPNLTVLQVIHKLPMASRFDTLLANTGVRQQLTGDGSYTIFVPANNYFDYLPKGAYISLTRAQELELAQHMVVSNAAIDGDSQSGSYITLAQDQLPVGLQDGKVLVGNGFAVRGYRASNGIVYLVNRVLAPEDLQATLSGE